MSVHAPYSTVGIPMGLQQRRRECNGREAEINGMGMFHSPSRQSSCVLLFLFFILLFSVLQIRFKQRDLNPATSSSNHLKPFILLHQNSLRKSVYTILLTLFLCRLLPDTFSLCSRHFLHL